MRGRGRYDLPRDTRPSVFERRHRIAVSDLDIAIWSFGALSLICCAAYVLWCVADLL